MLNEVRREIEDSELQPGDIFLVGGGRYRVISTDRTGSYGFTSYHALYRNISGSLFLDQGAVVLLQRERKGAE